MTHPDPRQDALRRLQARQIEPEDLPDARELRALLDRRSRPAVSTLRHGDPAEKH